MAEAIPVLLGTAGFVHGECFVLSDGSDIVIGRSRSCDISLRRAAKYLQAASEQRDGDQDFNTVSRRHLRLQVHESVIRVQDLSTNGTFCNDEPVQQAREVNLANGPFVLRLGTRETFQVILLSRDDPRVANGKAAEPQAAGPGSD